MEPRWVTADEAVSQVASGQSVFLSSGCGEPQALVDALIRNSSRWRDVRLLTGLQGSRAGYVRPDLAPHLRLQTFMSSSDVAEAIARGDADYTPVPLSRIPELMRSGRIRVDVAMVQVAPADSAGRYSLGVSVAYGKAAVESASIVIAEVNRRMPFTLGDAFISSTDIDFLVKSDAPILEVRRTIPDPSLEHLGQRVATLVSDGDTLQVGVGAVAEAVWKALHRHRDLGVHSGSIADTVIDLMDAGIVTNQRKSIDVARVVAGQLIGTERLYRHAHENAAFDMRPSDYTHDPRVLAQIDNLVSVNSALQVDLRGQVNAEMLRGRQVAGVGGAIDFTVGARLSRGGRSIIALPSTAGSGRYSRIVPRLDDAVVTTPASLVDFVVTEFGVADLGGLSLEQRARALIEVADPRHRPDLRAALERAV